MSFFIGIIGVDFDPSNKANPHRTPGYLPEHHQGHLLLALKENDFLKKTNVWGLFLFSGGVMWQHKLIFFLLHRFD